MAESSLPRHDEEASISAKQWDEDISAKQRHSAEGAHLIMTL